MHLYFGFTRWELKHYTTEKCLISYFTFKDCFEKNLIKNKKVFLDSGAFSAYNLKREIDIDDYIDFIKKNKFEVYAALDVIYNPQRTKENLEYMLKKDLNPIPVFHYKSSLENLESISKKFNYIALGGLVPLATHRRELSNWLNYCFKFLYPKIKQGLKVHGFGISSMELLKKFPFYSVDSTSWKWGGITGQAVNFDGLKIKIEKKNPLYKKFQLERNHIELNQKNINTFRKVEEFITKLWEKRGIKYE